MSVDTTLATAVREIGGDRAVSSARSLGKMLKFREGRIVHGLRLTGRQNSSTKTRVYRVNVVSAGFNGFIGFVSSHTEKGQPRLNNECGEIDPLNPLNPDEDDEEWHDIEDFL